MRPFQCCYLRGVLLVVYFHPPGLGGLRAVPHYERVYVQNRLFWGAFGHDSYEPLPAAGLFFPRSRPRGTQETRVYSRVPAPLEFGPRPRSVYVACSGRPKSQQKLASNHVRNLFLPSLVRRDCHDNTNLLILRLCPALLLAAATASVSSPITLSMELSTV